MGLKDDIDAAVEARMERQRVLCTGDRQFRVVIEEQVIRTRVGDADVMAGQLDRLMAVMSLPPLGIMSHDFTGPRPSGSSGHEALPVRGTLRRVKNGEQLNPPMRWDFPIVADCVPGGRVIRKEESMFSDWEHVE